MLFGLSSLLFLFLYIWPGIIICATVNVGENNNNTSRNLQLINGGLSDCELSSSLESSYSKYFLGMDNIYQESHDLTCLSKHKTCGWPKAQTSSNLPLFVLSVGLEGAGHHLWTEIVNTPVFDCVWINGRHYFRDISDGIP